MNAMVRHEEAQVSRVQPGWLSGSLYPFVSRWWESGEGRIHYIDEGGDDGEKEAIVFVHGVPTWSLLYRHLIRGLSPSYRCIAMDHLGFGLSDKPEGGTYHVADHGRRLEALLDDLGIERCHLVVHDFGGPIGLSYALAHPERIISLTLFNTWMWSMADDPQTQRLARFLSSRWGGYLYRRLNLSPRFLLKAAFKQRSRLTKALHAHYIKPFARPQERLGPWHLGCLLADPWFGHLWEQRERLAGLPMLVLWGMEDPAFSPDALARWEDAFGHAVVHRLAGVGHFPQEEAPEASLEAMNAFLGGL